MVLFKLTRYQEAIDALQNARHLFEEEGNQLWISFTDLETAALMLSLRDPEGCKNISEKCIVDFENLNHPVEAAFARLVAARAANTLEEMSLAEDLAQEALLVAGNQNIPFLTYQGNKILGQIAQNKNDIPTALIHYDLAISALEKMSGNMMTEYHSEFFEDKESVYESAADLCIHTGQPDLSLAYVERAKSRALLKILAFRPQLGIQAQDKGDEPLVAEINDLRLERERLLRDLDDHKFNPEKERFQEKITSVELQVTALWHKLLVRNAGYARQASIWQVQTEDARHHLEEGVLLLEYFSVGEQFFVFTLSQGEEVRAHRLSSTSAEIERHLQLFALNTRAVIQPGSAHKAELIVNAQALLGKLYQLLLDPICEELNKFHQLIIVPHGVLHYLPFHALYDGDSYLIERFPISYLPGSSFLGHYLNTKTAGHGIVSIGHSYHSHVPNAVLEADKIAQLFNTEPLLEEDAVLENLQDLVTGKQILHFACHGEFYPDNPLFSGLSLEDGWLTTLDVFNLRLPVSLVTLSACKTGRSVVGGGDELLGIMRAFLAAGAASLVLSHWAVEDRSTLILIETFYQNLISGKTKAEALQHAQVHLLTHRERPAFAEEHESLAYSHPYYWAPFFLIGDYRRL